MAQLLKKIEAGFPDYSRWIFHLSPKTYIDALVGIIVFSVAYWVYLLYLKLLSANDQKYALLEIKPTDRTLKSPLSTNQLLTILHSLVQGDAGLFYTTYRSISLEIASTKEEGIRFILRVPQKEASLVTKNIYSYLPGVEINQIGDYFSENLGRVDSFEFVGVQEMKLSNSYLLPLESQEALGQVDPIGYLTGQMTQLVKNELVVAQFIAVPVHKSTHGKIAGMVSKVQKRFEENLDISDLIYSTKQSFLGRSINWFINDFLLDRVAPLIGEFVLYILSLFINIGERKSKSSSAKSKQKYISELGVHKQKQFQEVHKKISQPLFDTTIRFVIHTPWKESIKDRLKGMASAYETVQSDNQKLKKGKYFKPYFDIKLLNKYYLMLIKDRLPITSESVILSASELSSLYHLPYTTTTKTEDISKNYYKELAAPLSLKKTDDLDVVFAKNMYGGVTTPIGLTKLERTGHMHVMGQTRSGKSTLIGHMIENDVQVPGRCVIVIDPHGDLVKEAINFIPEQRINDFVYISPRDIKHPIGINLLELSKTSDEDKLELEKDIVSEGTISVLRKVFAGEFAKGETNAFRIESILRNTIHTAFLTDDPTLFIIFDLLNNPQIRGQALQRITDTRLMDFWREEFGNSGDWARVKKVSPVNARIGRFLFSPILRRIMEKKKSTFSFDDVINNGKILFANLSKGEITEDNCEVLGTVIITKIRQAAEKRALMEPQDRRPVYLYIDEFQNFATPSFMKMLSELGKFGINIIIVEQSFSQQPEQRQTNIILSNTGNITTFKTANPSDEELMLAQFQNVEQGWIANLPRYHFYMKKGAVEPEEAFSGQVDPVNVKVDKEKVERFIQASIKNYASTYKKPEPTPTAVTVTDDNKNNETNHKPNSLGNGKPKNKPFTKAPQEVKNKVVKKPGYLTD